MNTVGYGVPSAYFVLSGSTVSGKEGKCVSMALTRENIYTEEDYENLSEDVRAELINGQFFNMSAPNRIHQKILMFLSNKIANHINAKGGRCEVYPAPFAVRLFRDRKTIVEPDISVICDKSKLTDRGCFGAPDWVIEIVSPSNPGHDYVRKLNLYAEAGVREYWIVNPMTKLVYVYYFEENCFKAVAYPFREEITGNVFEDFEVCLNEFDNPIAETELLT